MNTSEFGCYAENRLGPPHRLSIVYPSGNFSFWNNAFVSFYPTIYSSTYPRFGSYSFFYHLSIEGGQPSRAMGRWLNRFLRPVYQGAPDGFAVPQ